MKRDINTDTPLVPYIIAERAIWNVLEEDKKELSPGQCLAIVERFYPVLVAKAELLYIKNDHFRQQINNKRKDPRYTLEMFMEHWTKAIFKKKPLNNLINS